MRRIRAEIPRHGRDDASEQTVELSHGKEKLGDGHWLKQSEAPPSLESLKAPEWMICA
jgi:hypothetical protein